MHHRPAQNTTFPCAKLEHPLCTISSVPVEMRVRSMAMKGVRFWPWVHGWKDKHSWWRHRYNMGWWRMVEVLYVSSKILWANWDSENSHVLRKAGLLTLHDWYGSMRFYEALRILWDWYSLRFTFPFRDSDKKMVHIKYRMIMIVMVNGRIVVLGSVSIYRWYYRNLSEYIRINPGKYRSRLVISWRHCIEIIRVCNNHSQTPRSVVCEWLLQTLMISIQRLPGYN